MIRRRIVTEISPGLRAQAAKDPRRRCRSTIVLDGRTYRCGREQHEGIHDAFDLHADEGMVRW